MKNSISYKSKELGFLLIKIAIVSIAIVSIYFQLENKNNGNKLHLLEQQYNAFSVSSLFILLLFSSLNWFFEILKWQNLVTEIKKITIKESLIQTFTGSALAIFTPNGIGEYGAKMVYYPKNKTKKIIFLNLLTNGVQMAITVIFGIIGSIYIYTIRPDLFKSNQIICVFTSVCILLMAMYLLRNVRLFKISLNDALSKIKSIPFPIHLKNIVYGLLRYLIFCHQYYYILIVLDVKLTYPILLSILFIIYITASIIPSIQLFDIAIKGSIAVYLFGLFGIESLIILFAASIMWTFNFLIPSIIGTFYILKYKYQWK